MKTKAERSEAAKAAWARRRERVLASHVEQLKENYPAPDPVNHPSHYTSHPSGVECIQITEHLNFCVGNAVKYAWRAGEKGNYVQDLQKAIWYLQREIARVSK